MEVYQCKNCGKPYTHEPFECYKCESKDKLQKVTDYNLLMQFAENCLDTFEEKHYYANAALYFYVKEYHPLFAKRYEKVKFSTTKDLFHGDERLKLETIEYDSKIERKIFRKNRGKWVFYCSHCKKRVVSTEAEEYFNCYVFYSQTRALGGRTCSLSCAEKEVERLRKFIDKNKILWGCGQI